MAYVVLSGCIGCKHSDCVDVCPTDAFHEGPNMLVINPEDCIDCDLCVPLCPVESIVADTDVPENEMLLIEINDRLSQVWPNITKSKDSLSDAEKWEGLNDKLKFLIDYDGMPCAKK